MRSTPTLLGTLSLLLWICGTAVLAQETPYIYGIHDHDPRPQELLDRVSAGGARAWVTATIAIGRNPNDTGGDDFTWIASQGHSVIVRLNNGYCPEGSIPPPDRYDDFARRAANYVAATRGATHFVIGNETNLGVEWPATGGHASYVSPESYATLYRKVYAAIKAVRPEAKVLTQALAPFAGPFPAGSTCGYNHDANPLNWVQYLNRMLNAIRATGGIDGIALHINSRGYRYEDIHSTQRVVAGGQSLSFSFDVYRDWVDLGIPRELYHLPLYATEANGIYYWKGGHPERPDAHYEPGWVQEVYAEIDRYNREAASSGKPVYRAVNLYRWCAWCDGWNIDSNPYKGQILGDLDQAVSAGYRWPTGGTPPPPPPPPPGPGGTNLARNAVAWAASSTFNSASSGDKAYDGVVSAGSKWTSNGQSAESWLSLDLGALADVTGFVVRHAGAGGEPAYFNTQSFRLESASGPQGPWTTLATVANAVQAPSSTTTLATVARTRYVRLYVLDAGIDNYARIPELEVYGTAAPPPPPPPPPPPSDTNLVQNGDFAAGLQGWSVWTERGSVDVSVSNGQVHLQSANHNGGLFQQFSTGGPGSVIDLSGFWASDPTAAQSQWAEVLVINGPRTPVNGHDVTAGQADVVLAHKNDTWVSSGGWSGTMAATSPVASAPRFTATAALATIILKSGNVGGQVTGVRFDDVRATRQSAAPPPPAPPPPPPVLPDNCPSGALNFEVIRAELSQQGKDLAFVKTGFHVGPGGNATGLGEWMRCLDAAGVPFFLKSADSAGQIFEAAQLKAASGVPHVLVYRKSVGSGWNPDVPDYDKTPHDAAVEHWQRHRSAFPPELEPYKHLMWVETINEVDKNRSEWLAEFSWHTAQLAMAEGFNYAAFGWSSGEPEPAHWEGPWMIRLLELASDEPERLAIALHEYSFTTASLAAGYPHLVGRFQTLYDVADSYGLRRPTVLVTEFGWGYQDVPSVGQAFGVDLPWAAALYAAHPEVQGAAIWYLGPGFGGIANEAQLLIGPMTEYALRSYFVIPRP